MAVSEKILAVMESERAARNLAAAVAGELGATYDALSDEYRYRRDGGMRRLAIREKEGTSLKLIVYIQEVEGVLA